MLITIRAWQNSHLVRETSVNALLATLEYTRLCVTQRRALFATLERMVCERLGDFFAILLCLPGDVCPTDLLCNTSGYRIGRFCSFSPQVLVQVAPKVYEEGPDLETLQGIVQTFAEQYNTDFQANKVREKINNKQCVATAIFKMVVYSCC